MSDGNIREIGRRRLLRFGGTALAGLSGSATASAKRPAAERGRGPPEHASAPEWIHEERGGEIQLAISRREHQHRLQSMDGNDLPDGAKPIAYDVLQASVEAMNHHRKMGKLSGPAVPEQGKNESTEGERRGGPR